MTKREWCTAVAMAKDARVDLSQISVAHLDGCGLRGFEQTVTSIHAVAALLRWQCGAIFGNWNNGGWDEQEENELFRIAQRKFLISSGVAGM